MRCSPSPSRTMRLKLSSTRNPSPDGAATSMRQLLVPRSRAANVAPANRRGSAGSAAGSAGDWTFRGCITALSSPPASPGKLRQVGLPRFHLGTDLPVAKETVHGRNDRRRSAPDAQPDAQDARPVPGDLRQGLPAEGPRPGGHHGASAVEAAGGSHARPGRAPPGGAAGRSSTRRTNGRCCACCRPWTPPARTARSST